MSDLNGHKIALIGGAGFIGHNLAIRLQAAGADVEVIDSLMVNNLLTYRHTAGDDPKRGSYLRFIHDRLDRLNQAGIPLHILDAREYHTLSRTLVEIKPKTIVHLAAVANASTSNKDPYSTFDHSLRTLENALDTARSPIVGVEHFIYFSSSMVYGNFTEGSVTEDTVCEPLGIYGALKFSGEKMVIAYQQVFDLPYTIVRPSALYGERCVGRRVVQNFIENAMNGQPLKVVGDGEDRLDFTHIDDLCSGVAAMMTSPGSRNQIFNLTYGQSRSIAELAQQVKHAFPDTQIHHVERDRLMPARGTLNIDKARELVGYEPQVPLEEGLRRYVRWYQEIGFGDSPLHTVRRTRPADLVGASL